LINNQKIKITDFGVTKIENTLSSLSGTPKYFSPNLYQTYIDYINNPNKKETPKITTSVYDDMFASAVTFYQLVHKIKVLDVIFGKEMKENFDYDKIVKKSEYVRIIFKKGMV
jgi:serine/threonine protein kinase